MDGDTLPRYIGNLVNLNLGLYSRFSTVAGKGYQVSQERCAQGNAPPTEGSNPSNSVSDSIVQLAEHHSPKVKMDVQVILESLTEV